MTSATDELRRLLDERGVKWEDHSDESVRHTTWNGAGCWFTEFRDDGWAAFGMSSKCDTPAEAVEMTLGRGTCHIEEQGCEWRCTGCGEVVGSCDPSSELHVSGNFVEMWDHCPMCGRRVVK